ncbi:MAG: hypothetical protein U1G07_16220 [Verrucomicrobiota bacterium]
MKSINRDELFAQVSQFLKAKGIELQEGSYVRTIQKGCQVLADTINLSQQAMERAKSGVEKTFKEVRQTIHEKTAPKPPPASSTPPPTPAPAPEPAAASTAKAANGQATPKTPSPKKSAKASAAKPKRTKRTD